MFSFISFSLSLKKLDNPFSDISVIPSPDSLNIEPLSLSAKYFLKPYTPKDSGFLLIPNSPAYGLNWPITVPGGRVWVPPSDVYIVSLSIKALFTLSSWKTIKLVSSA